jgi:hypothetical protein
MSRKCIAKQLSKKQEMFALVTGPEGFEVWRLCKNYSGQVRGGICRTWRYVQKNMDEQSAWALFERRVAL